MPGYDEIFEMGAKKLRLMSKVRLIEGVHWVADLQGDTFVMEHLPYEKAHEPIFLHYLCHAKILEEGWVLPAVTPQIGGKLSALKKMERGERDARVGAWVIRSLDSFFDFFAWGLVGSEFGKGYLEEFISGVLEVDDKGIVAWFKRTSEWSGFRLMNYLTCVDWFAMFGELTASIDPGVEARLSEKFSSLCAQDGFFDAVEPVVEERVPELRMFYRKLRKKYPSYLELLQEGGALERHYAEYSKILWAGTGLDLILEF
ncbi:MAG: hypothetical protein ABH829_05395 [archaeon]